MTKEISFGWSLLFCFDVSFATLNKDEIRGGTTMKTIHVDELQEKLEAGEALHVVDVREQDEYDAGHIPNVRFLPMSEIGERYTELQEGETYYLICKAGARSENVGRFLEQYGYDIINVEGGMMNWKGDQEA
jgi:rhodanese-related sulfurtransferase